VLYAYARVGVHFPHSSRGQYQQTKAHRIPGGYQPSKYRPGDLIFYGSSVSSIHHVAISVGDGKLIQAPTAGVPVEVVPDYKADFYAATRPLAGRGGSHAAKPAKRKTEAKG
jgi:cell wall-associated NlpC family hydrolase